MKQMIIEGTIDLIGDATPRAHGMTYSYMSFITHQGNEVLVHHVCVDDDVNSEIYLGMTGEFVLQKTLFSTTLQKVRVATAA